MSKAYPSNLTRAQYEFLSDLLPAPKPGNRSREVDLLMGCRRLVRAYEWLPETLETLIYLAMIRIIVRHSAQILTPQNF